MDTTATIGGRSLDTILAPFVVMVFTLVLISGTLLALVLIGSGFSLVRFALWREQ